MLCIFLCRYDMFVDIELCLFGVIGFFASCGLEVMTDCCKSLDAALRFGGGPVQVL